MGKLTKKDRIKVLEWQVKTLIQSMTNIEEWSSCADNMLTELNHALPDPEYDAKREAQEADIDASLDRHRERLGLNKPQLKQLDQSIFNGLDEKWRFAAVDRCGEAWYSTHKTQPTASGAHLPPIGLADSMQAKGYYDASNWQNSLIERDIAKELLEVDLSSELTGSELCKAMLARGDTRIMCEVYDDGNRNDLTHVIRSYSDDKFHTKANRWSYAIPINNQGEPLTASEVGL